MRQGALLLIPLFWGAWALCWIVAAFGAKPVERRESIVSRSTHVLPLAVATWLLALPRLPGWLGTRFIPHLPALEAGAAILVAAGLAFAVWARLELGGNWSGIVALKRGHTIVRSGPYRWIRHPIYSGLLLATVGTAVARGEWRGPVAVLIIILALARKIRIEERFLGEAFGREYADYRATSWALVPLIY
jgi:protein-S-isoprenylcysteine O-methyltransferase Ste14